MLIGLMMSVLRGETAPTGKWTIIGDAVERMSADDRQRLAEAIAACAEAHAAAGRTVAGGVFLEDSNGSYAKGFGGVDIFAYGPLGDTETVSYIRATLPELLPSEARPQGHGQNGYPLHVRSFFGILPEVQRAMIRYHNN